MAILAPGGAPAEQASAPASPQAGTLDVDAYHSCALLASAAVRCWGHETSGQLGYAATNTIGDDETPASAGPVDLGPGRTARAVATGSYHSCAVLDDGSVRCWGYGTSGQLGYASTETIGDDETPGSAGPVDLGPGRTARAISAGSVHTCAVLDDGRVRCWGYGQDGRLGTANTSTIGDDETPGSIAPVDLGPGRTARAISAGAGHTCAVLDDGSVRCWGYGANGRLGTGARDSVGDDETPGSIAPVDLGPGRTATAITVGEAHSCAVLDDGSVRCWGYNRQGQLGYGNEESLGDNEAPGSVDALTLPAPAVAISAGDFHTCSVLAGGQVRCWGYGRYGLLGTAATRDIGDDESPLTIAAVDVGGGRAVTAISAGSLHTCARLADGNVRCWGYGANGRLGSCSDASIGDDESPAAGATVQLEGPAAACPAAPPSAAAVAAQARRRSAETLRFRRYNRCLAVAQRRVGRRRARQVCLERHGRTPGRVIKLRGRARSRTAIVLTFSAPGTDGRRGPAARRYLVKQSLRPMRTRRDIARAPALCRASCRFSVSRVGTRIILNVRNLRPRTRYHYRIAAYDNVTGRPGRSRGISLRTP
ncbi:MAG: hypothetical protein Q8K79_19685 [Solirubrobacteraceae bacterium]|nr:hypothetical protein [Solirubrobacteraceae bacterium]